MTGMSGWNITVVIVALLAGFFGVAIAEAVWQHATFSDLQGYFTFMFPLLSAFLGLGAGGLATYALKNQQTQALQDQNQNLKDVSKEANQAALRATAASAAADTRANAAEQRARSADQAALVLARSLPNDKLGELARQIPVVNDVLARQVPLTNEGLGAALWPVVAAPPPIPPPRTGNGQPGQTDQH